MGLRDGCAILLLWCLFTGAQAISPDADPWQYCATNHAWAYACFGSLQEAEDWLRQEPLEPTGRRFLEPTGRVDVLGGHEVPTGVRTHYSVRNQPPARTAESYVKALMNTSTMASVSYDCIDGVTPICYGIGSTSTCADSPSNCHACVNSDGNTHGIRQALLEFYGDKCGVSIASETAWPSPPNSVKPGGVFNWATFGQHVGAFEYSNGYSMETGHPLQPFNKLIVVAYGDMADGQCVNIRPRREFWATREHRIECNTGLTPVSGIINPQNHYTNTVAYGDICRSPVTGYVDAHQIPSAQCSYGNPCNPGSGEKVWDEADASGAVPLTRSYSSLGLGRADDTLGPGWSLGYSARLIIPGGGTPTHVLAVDARGRESGIDSIGSRRCHLHAVRQPIPAA